MDIAIAAILGLDGLTNGVVYALVAVALVMLFSVTRVIFVPQGELIAFGALTLAQLQAGHLPAIVWLLATLAVLAMAADTWQAWRAGRPVRAWAWQTLRTGAPALSACGLTAVAAQHPVSGALHVVLVLLLVTLLGPLLYRLAFRWMVRASVLSLLVLSIGLHIGLTGLGLLMFGAEGQRSLPYLDARYEVGPLAVPGQTALNIAVAIGLFGALSLYFGRTLAGKSLRATAVNALGARLMGISTERAGAAAFTLAAFIGALSGILLAPTATLYYDSGFLIALKGFIAAVFAGMASYPLALVGAAGVGLLEAYGAFFAGPFKEVLVFAAVLPILLWRSMLATHGEEH